MAPWQAPTKSVEPSDWKDVEPSDWKDVTSHLGITTEESEHARQLTPATPHPALASGLDRLLAPSDMTGNDPNTLKGYAKTWGEFLKGAGQGIRNFIASPPPGTDGNPVIWNPAEQLKKDWQGVKDAWNEGKKNPNYVSGEVAGPVLLTHALSSFLEPAGMAAKLTRATNVTDARMIENTISDLRMAAKETGKPRTIGEFVDSVSHAENKLNGEFADSLGKYAPYKINLPDTDGNFPLSKAIKALKDKYPPGTEINNAARRMIDTRAAEYERPISLADMNRERINADARRFGLYQQSDMRAYATSTAGPENAVDNTIADWVRNNAYPEMDKLTGKPDGYFRNLQQRVGNLMRIQSETKDNAVKLHTEALKSRGATRWERARPGTSISQSGKMHTYIPNIPEWLRPGNPEEGANAAVRSAYGIHQQFHMPSEAMSLPVSALLGVLRGHNPVGPKTQQLQEMRYKATELMHESPEAELPPQIQRIEHGLKVRYVKGQPYGNAVASVGEHDPRTIEVNDVDRFNKGPLQTRGHEIVHLWRNNLPGPIQKMAMPDNASDPYNISKIDDLRAKGYNLATIPQEMAATIVQTYIADPSQRKRLQPWIDDMDKIPMSVVEGTDPGQKGINTAPRPPMPPTESYRQLKAISARYR